VWVFNVDTGKRLSRIKLPEEMFCIAVSQDKDALLYSSSIWVPAVYVFDATSGEQLRQLNSSYGSMNTILQPVEPR
jgi:methylamine dehydrogenase heavy chain